MEAQIVLLFLHVVSPIYLAVQARRQPIPVKTSGNGVLIRPIFQYGLRSTQYPLQLAMAELCQP